MMVNGKILLGAGGIASFDPPTFYYEYDYVTNAFTPVSSPTGGASFDGSAFAQVMLDLPDGSVLLLANSPQLYVYKPVGQLPPGHAAPVVQTVTRNPDGSYHVTGTGFNGISEGSNYGDEFQNTTAYPIARLTDSAGKVYYARTFNWSDTVVQTGNRRVTTEMTLPAGLPHGQYNLFIIANGISSGDGFPINY